MASDSDAIAVAERREPASKNSHEDAGEMNTDISTDGTSNVAKARWTLLRQV